jgi:putative sporulation protein YyaC
MLFAAKKSVIDINDNCASINFSNLFKYHIYSNMDSTYKSLVLVCIGTDRSTGDSLGPMVGYKLSKFKCDGITIYGTLDEPVHAKNLTSKLGEVFVNHQKPFVVAIDACLGHQQNVGHINIANGPIYPGAGVNKNLLPVGNINVTGIVNVSGYMEYFVLQNTRLNLVMKMADIITQGIITSIEDINEKLSVQYI